MGIKLLWGQGDRLAVRPLENRPQILNEIPQRTAVDCEPTTAAAKANFRFMDPPNFKVAAIASLAGEGRDGSIEVLVDGGATGTAGSECWQVSQR